MTVYYRGCVKKENRLGWVKDIQYSMSQDFTDVTEYGSAKQFIPVNSHIEFTVSGIATSTSGVISVIHDWARNGIFEATYQHEWMCLYCASPNSIMQTHCAKCGAPRSFILG